MNGYAKTGRPKGISNADYERMDRVTTRAGDLEGRCPKCHLLLPADCTPDRCMARVAPFDQLENIRKLFVAMVAGERRDGKKAVYEAGRSRDRFRPGGRHVQTA